MEEFLRRTQKWQHYYNVERSHFGVGMNGKSPLKKLRELGYDLPDEFAPFPVILLDEVVMIRAFKGSHHVLAYYYIYSLAQTERYLAGALVPISPTPEIGQRNILV